MSTVPIQIQEASDEGLLRTFAALTHSIHVSDEPEYRAKRDIIEAEILRRMRS